MKVFSMKSLFFLIFTLLINSAALSEKHLEVQKLYELYIDVTRPAILY